MSKRRTKHPTVGDKYETDQLAMHSFEGWLPASWPKRKRQPDFFLDYVVETAAEGELTGREIAFQLKGTRNLKRLPGCFTYSVKTKHVRYWLNDCRYPVFFVLVDVVQRKGWWLFVQQYAREAIASNDLTAKKTVTFRIPVENSFDDLTRFERVLPIAEAYVRDLHPSSIEAAIRKAKCDLEVKDPRFTVSVTAAEGCQNFLLSPKPGVQVATQVRTKRPDVIRGFLEHGQDIRLESGEFEMFGSPLFEELNGKENSALLLRPEVHPATLQIASSSTPIETTLVDGTFRSGTKTLRFEASLQNSPLEMSWTADWSKLLAGGDGGSLGLALNPNAWADQQILGLAHFDAVFGVVRCLTSESDSVVVYFIRGQRIGSGCFQRGDGACFAAFLPTLEWLQMCRIVARHLKVNPRLPNLADISDEQWAAAIEAFQLLTIPMRAIPAQEGQISLTVDRTYAEASFKMSAGAVRIENPNLVLNLLGTPVSLGRVRTDWTNVRLASAEPAQNGGTKLVFTVAEGCRQVVSLVDRLHGCSDAAPEQ